MSLPAAIIALFLFVSFVAGFILWACCYVGARSEARDKPFDDDTDWEPEVGMFTIPEVYGDTPILGGARHVRNPISRAATNRLRPKAARWGRG